MKGSLASEVRKGLAAGKGRAREGERESQLTSYFCDPSGSRYWLGPDSNGRGEADVLRFWIHI